MTIELSKSQIDHLGDRLKAGPRSEEDLRLLEKYRQSFASAYLLVLEAVRQECADELNCAPTGRAAKSTESIVHKLQRESIRLSQMQDIAGCRIVLPDTALQESAVARLTRRFAATATSSPQTDVATIDRRDSPSHGYRAVHLVVRIQGKYVEIQVRTLIQHAWAEMSERFADQIDQGIKYGAGPEEFQHLLLMISAGIADVEKQESKLMSLQASLHDINAMSPEIELQLKALSDYIEREKASILGLIDEAKELADRMKEEPHDIPD